MNAHTPGPWRAKPYTRSSAWVITLTPDDVHGDIANVIAGLGAKMDLEVAANARLIAAAPEMLAMLIEVQMANTNEGLCDPDLDALIARLT